MHLTVLFSLLFENGKRSLILSDAVAELVMGSWTTWFLDFNKRGAWNKRSGAKFGPFLINVVAEIAELWVKNSQEINCCDITSIQEGRVNLYKRKLEKENTRLCLFWF